MNRTTSGIVLSEFVLSGDPLYTINWNTYLLTGLLTIPLKKYLGSHNDDWHLGKFGILNDASFHSGNFACCRQDSDILSTCEPVSKVFRSRLRLRHLFLKTLVFFWLEAEQGVASVHHLVMHASFRLEWVKWNQFYIKYNNLRIT